MTTETVDGITISTKSSELSNDKADLVRCAKAAQKALKDLPTGNPDQVVGYLLANKAQGGTGTKDNAVAMYVKRSSPFYGVLPEGWNLYVYSDEVTLSSKHNIATFPIPSAAGKVVGDIAWGNRRELIK